MAGEQAHDYQGQVIAEFLDAEGVLPGTFATPLLPHVATGGWAETIAGAVPPGAQQVRMRLRAVLVYPNSSTMIANGSPAVGAARFQPPRGTVDHTGWNAGDVVGVHLRQRDPGA